MSSLESKPTRDDLFYTPSASIAITWGQFFVGIALYVLSYYLIDDAFSYWSDTAVTSSNMLKFMIGLILLAPGLLLWQSGLFRLASHTGYHWIATVLVLTLLTVLLLVFGALYFVEWGIADWLEWDTNFDSTTLVRLFQGVFLVLTVWLTAVVMFHVLLRTILTKSLFAASAYGAAMMDEAQPLMDNAPDKANDNKKDTDDDAFRVVPPEEREGQALWDSVQEYSAVFLFFFFFLPLFLWVNCVNVSDWHRMYPQMILTKLMSTTALTDTWNTYFSFTCGYTNTLGVYVSSTCYARLYFDVLVWYLFVLIVSLIAYVVNKVPSARIAMQKRILLPFSASPILSSLVESVSVTIGEIVFWVLWLGVMISTGYYWVHIHMYDEDDTKTTLEIWARYTGIMAIMFMTMMLFCTTRIRLWNDVFMLSVEHLLGYHKFFAILMLLTGYIHMVLWIAFWKDNISDYPSYLPFEVPLSYHSDNFTPIMMYYVMLLMVPVIYFGCAFWTVRRKYFEVFYYAHLVGALIMVSALLWHASQAWRYLIPPLALYAIDRMIRLAHSARLCRVTELSVSVNGEENANRIEVTKMAFEIGSYALRDGRAAFKRMEFKMGQYVMVNVSNISLWQWHPFTIASGEEEGQCYLHIQNEGNKLSELGYDSELKGQQTQFTQMLYLLAQKVGANGLGAHEVELHVDGPYGKPFVYDGYERVILVAGGIGITPCHSIFSTMLARSMQSTKEKGDKKKKMPCVDLLWVAKDSRMFSMFAATWRKYEEHNAAADNAFSVRLFATRMDGQGGVQVMEDEDGDEDERELERADTEFNHVVAHTAATMYTYGRPDWGMVLNTIDDGDNEPATTLVFACGPTGMVHDVERHAVAKGARFQSECFVF